MHFRHPIRARARRLLNRLRYGRRLGPLFGRFQWSDDFDWSSYTEDSYRQELRNGLEPLHTSRLDSAQWSVENGRVTIRDGKPLHPNHSVLYEVILKLRPTSIFEFGCGGCDHLANLRALLPATQLDGVDISAAQLAFARERNRLDDTIRLLERDMTRAQALEGWLLGHAELVYTQAVLMHIHGFRRAEQFLRNMARVSSRYIVLVENWTRHPYMRLIRHVLPGCEPRYLARSGALAIVLDKANSLHDWPRLESHAALYSRA